MVSELPATGNLLTETLQKPVRLIGSGDSWQKALVLRATSPLVLLDGQ